MEMLIKCYVKLLTSRLSMAALASVEYRCSIYVGCYLQQTVLFGPQFGLKVRGVGRSPGPFPGSVTGLDSVPINNG